MPTLIAKLRCKMVASIRHSLPPWPAARLLLSPTTPTFEAFSSWLPATPPLLILALVATPISFYRCSGVQHLVVSFLFTLPGGNGGWWLEANVTRWQSQTGGDACPTSLREWRGGSSHFEQPSKSSDKIGSLNELPGT